MWKICITTRRFISRSPIRGMIKTHRAAVENMRKKGFCQDARVSTNPRSRLPPEYSSGFLTYTSHGAKPSSMNTWPSLAGASGAVAGPLPAGRAGTLLAPGASELSASSGQRPIRTEARPRQAPNSSASRPRREQQRGHSKACSIRGSPFLPFPRPSSASATAKTYPSSLASPLRASPTHASQWLFGDWGRAGRGAEEPGPARSGVRACPWLPAYGILGRSRKDDEG